MSDETGLLDYLERGGKITAPDNAPPRYRAELMRQMASFVDSALAGAAGFADLVNDGPGVKERIAAARIVLEKLDHAARVLAIMGDFGANIERYENVHPWAARIAREEDIGARRRGGDMRLNVFHYPLEGWTDAVVMNVLMGRATVIQLGELARGSYQPLAEVFAAILPRERRHAELGEEGLEKIARGGPAARREIRRSVEYWRPRVDATFGAPDSPRFALLKRFGLRHTPNEALREEWRSAVRPIIERALTDG
ncbi:Phenylacetic acid catabolic protein [Amphiplicatus metriothermophilus]|uniref:1,2-phenylacetyl-CoA epoxidase, catalytic subunit n=1 Tax=Amphiplicatus metriothermophilus TaxID=1519374 RepID=A0A239PW98_9PROT|nr:Phenylacetic acid catabolic protein [Amphiplicatus metriothermophilus]MBB5519663.1 1,2-phenylacetyl-CoA epoxidase catalytic subunit [Amphiplicatus metriothermophilus]SNT74226.1 1,2-phenylacetyl-CoA epoxidase, catalytic subunit [Amphiplicatus metriothermophilus]